MPFGLDLLQLCFLHVVSSPSHHDSPIPVPETKKSSKATYLKKIGDGLGKTKAIASTGVKKVKEGTAVGLHWIRDKYQKN